jgi:hypothetical protein
MTTFNKISSLVEQQLPSYVREDGPNLVAFLKAYYEYLEQDEYTVDGIKNLLAYNQIDNTLDKYIKYFTAEVIPSIPESVLTDKRLLAKHILDLYKTKGTQRSYELLFRIMYNEDVSFYYPSQDILRASDGRWTIETSIRLGKPSTGDITSLVGSIVTGVTSGASARVNRVTSAYETGLFITELFLNNIQGTFQDNELVRNSDNTISGTVVNSVGPITNITITQGGALHRTGDRVRLTSTIGSGANAIVTQTTDSSAILFELKDGGSGYRVGSTVESVIGGSGSSGMFNVTAISNTEIITLNSDLILPMVSVPLNAGPAFVSGGANTSAVSASLAAANVASSLNTALTFANATVGTISAIETTNYGYGYSTLPLATAVDLDVALNSFPDGNGKIKGQNAVITANNQSGAIVAVNVINPGVGYDINTDINLLNLTRNGTQAALGRANVRGVVIYPGRYTDTKGFLSWNNKLQDNYYYQEYSYVIRSDVAVDTYRKFVKGITHPSGTILFGDIFISSNTTNNVTPSTNFTKFTLGTGTIFGTSNVMTLTGNSSTFTTEVSNNSSIMVNDPASGNTIYTVSAVSNNTTLTITFPRPSANISNASFYYSS